MEKDHKSKSTVLERNGLRKMRMLNKEFLASNKGSEKVRDFLTEAGSDDAILLIYLKGRKYRPEHAWETLKRKAEVRCDEYPDAFSSEVPRCMGEFKECGIWGILKNTDKQGRRILCCFGRNWDPAKYSLADVTNTAVYISEKLLLDKDALNNGVVYIQNCEGMGMSHAKHYTLHEMLRILNIFWYACPLMFKGVYFINVPFYLTFIYGIIKPFFSKKLKERVTVTTTSKKFQVVHANVGQEILPKNLGGQLEDTDAFEQNFFS